MFTQQIWNDANYFGKEFAKTACLSTAIVNIVSSVYQKQNSAYLSIENANKALAYAIEKGGVDFDNAYVKDIAGAANAMGEYLGLQGKFSANESSPQYAIFAFANDLIPSKAKHFVNALTDIYGLEYFDVSDGKIKTRVAGVMNEPELGLCPITLRLQEGRPIRGLDYNIEE